MIREEVFYLLYCVKGMTYSDLEVMPVVDRKWMLERLARQLDREKAEIEKVRNK